MSVSGRVIVVRRRLADFRVVLLRCVFWGLIVRGFVSSDAETSLRLLILCDRLRVIGGVINVGGLI